MTHGMVIPDEFNGIKKWGATCPSLKEIRDQGSCGSCWVCSVKIQNYKRTMEFYTAFTYD